MSKMVPFGLRKHNYWCAVYCVLLVVSFFFRGARRRLGLAGSAVGSATTGGS